MLQLASRSGFWAQSLQRPTRRECLVGPTRQCNHATLPLLQGFQPFRNLKSLLLPGAYKPTHSSPARSASHRCMGKAISLLRPPREDEAGKMELRKRPRPRRVDPDFVSSPPPLPPRKRARKQAAATKPKDAAAPPKRQPPTKRVRRPAVGIGCPVAGLHRVMCGRQPLPSRMSTRVLFRPRRPFIWYAACVGYACVLVDGVGRNSDRVWHSCYCYWNGFEF